MREIKTNLNNILSLISCAEDYRFENGVLFDAFAGMMDRKLADIEIEAYAIEEGAQEWCGPEDYLLLKNRLTNFKSKYIDNI